MSKRKRVRAARGAAESKAFQIARLEQLQAVVSTKRHDIMDQMTAGGPMSVRELAEAMGVAPSSLYYHVEHLCAVGLLKEAGSRANGGRPEQVYAAPSRRIRMFEALQEPKKRKVLKAIVGSICKQAAKDFSRGFAAPHLSTAGVRRNVRFARLVGRPDAAALERINAHLDAITELLAASAQGKGKPIAISWVAAPLRGKPRDS